MKHSQIDTTALSSRQSCKERKEFKLWFLWTFTRHCPNVNEQHVFNLPGKKPCHHPNDADYTYLLSGGDSLCARGSLVLFHKVRWERDGTGGRWGVYFPLPAWRESNKGSTSRRAQDLDEWYFPESQHFLVLCCLLNLSHNHGVHFPDCCVPLCFLFETMKGVWFIVLTVSMTGRQFCTTTSCQRGPSAEHRRMSNGGPVERLRRTYIIKRTRTFAVTPNMDLDLKAVWWAGTVEIRLAVKKHTCLYFKYRRAPRWPAATLLLYNMTASF